METIAIVSVVDVVGALAADALAGSLYLFDDNKANGSTGHGSEALKTKVKMGDQLVWVCLALEGEAYVSIAAVEIEDKYREYCEPKQGVYPGTNVVYWVGTIKKDLDRTIPYGLAFKLGSRNENMATTTFPSLIGDGEKASATETE
jgi:hypothetical protein